MKFYDDGNKMQHAVFLFENDFFYNKITDFSSTGKVKSIEKRFGFIGGSCSKEFTEYTSSGIKESTLVTQYTALVDGHKETEKLTKFDSDGKVKGISFSDYNEKTDERRFFAQIEAETPNECFVIDENGTCATLKLEKEKITKILNFTEEKVNPTPKEIEIFQQLQKDLHQSNTKQHVAETDRNILKAARKKNIDVMKTQVTGVKNYAENVVTFGFQKAIKDKNPLVMPSSPEPPKLPDSKRSVWAFKTRNENSGSG